MIQYLLNTTAIWLISLAIFDLFLKRESYHIYNRAYLLITLLAGILLPLIQWQDDTLYSANAFTEPVTRVISAKKTMVNASPEVTFGIQELLLAVYLVGVCAATCVLIIEVIKMLSLYNAGRKYKADGWLIVETGKSHAPFSFLNLLFVCSREQYSDREWQMILAHEYRHTRLVHAADLILMQLVRIAFWFHPLVYVYNKRLLMVHEYQADLASAQTPRMYGQFLVDQALLQSAPVIAHSLNRSPIKNRIIMLTKKSSAMARSKMLLFVPLAAVCTMCFSKNSFSQSFEKHGDFVTYNGNKIQLSKEQIDTVSMTDPKTGKEMSRVIKMNPRPIKLNDEKIFSDQDEPSAVPVYKDGAKQLEQYIIKSLHPVAKELADGTYALDLYNIVTDKQGRIAYFENHGLMKWEDDPKAPLGTKQTVIDKPEVVSTVDKMIKKMPAFTPAKVDVNPVAYNMSILLRRKTILVHDHNISIVDSK